jgi:hypothetical protein
MRLRSTDPVASPEDESWGVLHLHRLIEINVKFPVVAGQECKQHPKIRE